MRTEKRANSEQERGKGMIEELRIRGSMGDIYGVLTVPEGKEPVPLIILSHGFGGNHLGQQDYAAYFVKEGFATYNFDFCGGGGNSKSAGSMLEMTVLTEAEDLRAIAEHFKGDARFSCILLWGASQGGFVSALVSAGCPETFRAVVLEFPAIVLQDDARKRANPDGSFPEQSTVMGWTISHKYNEAAVSFDLYEKIGAYTGPVLILHGGSGQHRSASLFAEGQGDLPSGGAGDNARTGTWIYRGEPVKCDETGGGLFRPVQQVICD